MRAPIFREKRRRLRKSQALGSASFENLVALTRPGLTALNLIAELEKCGINTGRLEPRGVRQSSFVLVRPGRAPSAIIAHCS